MGMGERNWRRYVWELGNEIGDVWEWENEIGEDMYGNWGMKLEMYGNGRMKLEKIYMGIGEQNWRRYVW